MPKISATTPATSLVGVQYAGIQGGRNVRVPQTLLDAEFMTSAEVAASYQPLDADLTAIAALTTTSFGRGLLTETDAASARTTLDAEQAFTALGTAKIEDAAITPAKMDSSADFGDAISVNVIPSYGKTRTLEERARDYPSVLDYDGVDETAASDSTVGLQRAIDVEGIFGGRRELVIPGWARLTTSAPLVVPYRGLHLRGGSKVGSQILADHDGTAIIVGDTSSGTGYAPRTVIESFSIYGGADSTGGIHLLDKETQTDPLWADASKGCTIRDIYATGIDNGPAFRVESWGNLLEHCEVSGGLYGFIINKQAHSCTLIKPYITGCAKEGMIIGDAVARNETDNLEIFGAIVQQCGGAPSGGAILLRGVAGVAFYGLYLERNGEKDAIYDIEITDIAVNTIIENVTSRSPAASGVIRDGGINTLVRNVWNFGDTDAIVRRADAVCTGHYENLYQASGTLANAHVRDLATGSAAGLYAYINGGVQRVGADQKRRIGKTASFTVPSDATESGAIYHVQSAGTVVITLPADATDGDHFQIACAGGGTYSLSAAGSGTINGGASKSLTGTQLYTVVCSRNNGGSAAQWMTRA